MRYHSIDLASSRRVLVCLLLLGAPALRMWGETPAAGGGAIASTNTSAAAKHPVRVETRSYHGWEKAIVLNNGTVEAVVVPAVGRVMQFGFAGQPGVLWENRSLDGHPADPTATNWVNYGGDKAWPSPEKEWGNVTGQKAWRPPLAFDGRAHTAQVDGSSVVMTSEIDAAFGIRVQRRITLDPDAAVLRVTTRFDKVSGPPVRAGVWVVTQMGEARGIFVPTPDPSLFGPGYTSLSELAPSSLARTGNLLTLQRDRALAHKIGTDAETLIWAGRKAVLRIDAPRVRGVEYPDFGSSAEVYTNPDPLPYIELELLGPVKMLKAGDKLEQSSIYRLYHRSYWPVLTQVQKILRDDARSAAQNR